MKERIEGINDAVGKIIKFKKEIKMASRKIMINNNKFKSLENKKHDTND